MGSRYVKEWNTLILVSLLKEHGIKKIIISPGTTNMAFALSVQSDPYFEVYSAVDERSAAFIACGLADASNEIVVLSCTGATASRNYLPGLTEAFYRKLPILAITSSQSYFNNNNYIPQFIDRTVQFRDLVKFSLQAPALERYDNNYVTQVNRAILELTHNENGPVHINLEFSFSGKFVQELPKIRKITRYYINDTMPTLKYKKIGIFVGAHLPFSKEEEELIDKFCNNYNAIVLCDQTSNYRGKFRYLAYLTGQQSADFSSKKFDIIIHLGSISGGDLRFCSVETWRVNNDGEVRDTFGNLTSIFQMDECDFFEYYLNVNDNHSNDDSLFRIAQSERNRVLGKIPNLPFSNLWIAQQLSTNIPDNAIIHLAILNSLRSWNVFETKRSVMCYSNVGGFGIDGCLSSFIGAALANPNKQFYGVFGDLSFFYDIGALVNDIPNNVHILLINNGLGIEFKNYGHPASKFGTDADIFIAAKGHNGYKSRMVVKCLSKDVDIKYFSASNKEEFVKYSDDWLKQGKSILEVFTLENDESHALELINNIEVDRKKIYKTQFKSILSKTKFYKILKILVKGE